jgi:hypothetical protein
MLLLLTLSPPLQGLSTAACSGACPPGYECDTGLCCLFSHTGTGSYCVLCLGLRNAAAGQCTHAIEGLCSRRTLYVVLTGTGSQASSVSLTTIACAVNVVVVVCCCCCTRVCVAVVENPCVQIFSWHRIHTDDTAQHFTGPSLLTRGAVLSVLDSECRQWGSVYRPLGRCHLR